MRKLIAVAALAVLVFAGCKSSDDSAGTSDTTTTGTEVPTGPAPGVTADSIKVGITYNDLESIRDFTKVNLGDDQAAFQALIDDVNAKGGINGRRIDPVYAGVSPIGTTSSDEACLKLTEDQESFVVMGYFQDDQILCYVDTHATAALGGIITPERQAKAKAPWYTLETSSDFEVKAIREFADGGDLDGKLGVVATIEGEPNLNEVILPLLDELGVPYVESAVIDAPDNDAAAQNAAVASIAERFQSEGIDTVLLTGESGLTWARGLEQSTYRPRLVFTLVSAIRAYTNSGLEGQDFSMFDGAIAGGLYEAPSNEVGSAGGLDECIAIQEAAGLTVLPPDDVPEGEPIQIAATSNACKYMSLLVQLLEAAGPDLNYGTFAAAGAEMGPVTIPGYPDQWSFGTGEDAAGNPTAYIWTFDAQQEDFVAPT
jgi:hypothetical protein